MIAARQIAFGRGAKKKEEPPAYWGLCFTAEAANSSVQLTAVGSAPVVTLIKSFDGANWESYAVGEVIELPRVGDFVYLAAGEGGNNAFGASADVYHNFVINGLVAASGDITSLRRFDLEQTKIDRYCYIKMFNGCTGLTSAPELLATTLATGCYASMFSGCTGLTSAPELPATTLATACYANMFSDCTGLTSAPKLPATTLMGSCYANMFNGCTGLTSAPKLPATTLMGACYSNMFSGCTGLTSAPELLATTLATGCYRNMFSGCTGLTSAPELLATTLAPTCYSNMFSGCTGLTSAPELPATTLMGSCYADMFSGCTGLTSAPELLATTLAPGCYRNMFSGCINMALIKVYFTEWSSPTNSWVNGVSPTGTFICPTALGTNETIQRGASYCPKGWTVINEG